MKRLSVIAIQLNSQVGINSTVHLTPRLTELSVGRTLIFTMENQGAISEENEKLYQLRSAILPEAPRLIRSGESGKKSDFDGYRVDV